MTPLPRPNASRHSATLPCWRCRTRNEAITLGALLLRDTGLPAKARADALHVAVSVVTGLEYLLTWNCAHIANATIRRRIEAVCRNEGFEPPIICTPEELLEE